MFGVDNTGVINQRQSPAIWQSDSADFPPNYILGRILIDSTTGQIFLDTSNSRLQISNGSNAFVNGLTSYGGTPTNSNIGLGGDLNYSTVINVNGSDITFEGSNNNVQIDSDGNLRNVAQGAYYFWGNVVSASVIIQDATIIFRDEQNNRNLKVAAQTI
jgi:predicted ribosome-associated RNA-binding protein Tma20